MECDAKKISRQLLKTLSGEFDLESIRTIDLSGLNIEDLGDISACVCLESLDLSGNNIRDLRPLAPLKQLTHLDLANNSISFIDTLGELDSLKVLILAGNAIKSLDSLKCLSSLSSLESLRLQDGADKNPVCDYADYHRTVQMTLPTLRALDDERLTGPGSSVFKLFREMQQDLGDSIIAPGADNVPSPSPWVSKDFWRIAANRCSEEDDAEKHFKEIFRECNDLNAAAEKSLEQTWTQHRPVNNMWNTECMDPY